MAVVTCASVLYWLMFSAPRAAEMAALVSAWVKVSALV